MGEKLEIGLNISLAEKLSYVINYLIRTLASDDQVIQRLGGGWKSSNRIVPYYGWYWRFVGFNKRIVLAQGPEGWGFCEDNKWNYPQVWLDVAASKLISANILEYLVLLIEEAPKSRDGLKTIEKLLNKLGDEAYKDFMQQEKKKKNKKLSFSEFRKEFTDSKKKEGRKEFR